MLLSLAWPTVASAQTAGPCQYVLGFKTLHDLDPGDIGDCQENQSFAPNGDAQQHTSKGLMAWRKVDNWTAFTNGYMTWINGPAGLASRLNTQRLSWEANQEGLPVVGGAAPAAPAPSTPGTPAPPPITLDAFTGTFVCNTAIAQDDGGGYMFVIVFNQTFLSVLQSGADMKDRNTLLAVSRDMFGLQLNAPFGPQQATPNVPPASYVQFKPAVLKGDPSWLRAVGISADGKSLVLLQAQGALVLHRVDANDKAALGIAALSSC
ncbi:MAG TPA: hypothetical protein VF157_14560 [Chloroflexota bacterium]